MWECLGAFGSFWERFGGAFESIWVSLSVWECLEVFPRVEESLREFWSVLKLLGEFGKILMIRRSKCFLRVYFCKNWQKSVQNR